jgi:predicted metalloprotease with PDZ domain
MLALALLATLQVSDTVRYELSFPNASQHEAEISVTFPATGRDTLDIRMSRSSPGRYALHEFAKNVFGVHATDGRGNPLAIHRVDPYRWLVTGHDGTVVFHYKLFADRGDGTYAQIDRSHAHLNAPAVFAWAAGLGELPAALKFNVPPGSNWRAATQLERTGDPLRFTAPNLQYLLDSPVELSDHSLRSWTIVGPGGRVDTIHLAVHHLGTVAEVDAYAEMAKKVVAEQVAIYGETARFDNGSYVFIADYLPWAAGDGMEHRNSTVISSTGSLARSADALLGTLSHEFLHSWNIERIRPAMLEPFDFFNADPSDALWFGEGFTSYYDDLTIRRAGLMNDGQYASGISGFVNAVINSPARAHGSPMEMSLRAPFIDAAASIDPTNASNTFLSYYTWGAGIGLALDLEIRGRFAGKDLDGLMRLMWQRHGAGGRYEVPRPYVVDDIERALADYTGDATFAREFFARFIRGRESPDFARLLAQAGMTVRQVSAESAWIGGSNLRFGQEGVTVVSPPAEGTPLFKAGIGSGDRITHVGSVAITSDSVWDAVMSSHRPGAVVPVTVATRGAVSHTALELAPDPRVVVVPNEALGTAVTEAQRAFREQWLGAKAGL